MQEPYLPPAVLEAMRRRRRSRRRLLWAGILLVALPPLLMAAICIPTFFYNRHQAELALREAVEETDKLDPGWRFETLKRKLSSLPLAENAAPPLVLAASKIPRQWYLSGEFTDKEFWDLFLMKGEYDDWHVDAPKQMKPELVEQLRKATAPYLAAVTIAEQSVPLKSGYYLVPWQPGGISIPQWDDAQRLGHYLFCVAIVACADGNYDEAWRTIMIIKAAERSFGDQPTHFPMISAGWQARILQHFEYCLAQGNVSEPLLADTQKRLMEEDADPTSFYRAMRGIRASSDYFLRNLESGKENLAYHSAVRGDERYFGPWDALELLLAGNTFKRDHAWMLHRLNDFVEASKLPPREVRSEVSGFVRRYC